MSVVRPFGPDYDYLFKLLIIGDSGVGKSSLMIRFADDTFSESHIATIGVDFKIRTIEIASKSVKLQIWDTAGQDRFKVITANYYRSANAIILVYDISNYESFQNIGKWMQEIEKYAMENVMKLLVGNKSDFERKRLVPRETGQIFANQFGMKFLETSAKSNVNVEQTFAILAEDLKENHDLLPSEKMKDSFTLGHHDVDEINKKKSRFLCCFSS